MPTATASGKSPPRSFSVPQLGPGDRVGPDGDRRSRSAGSRLSRGQPRREHDSPPTQLHAPGCGKNGTLLRCDVAPGDAGTPGFRPRPGWRQRCRRSRWRAHGSVRRRKRLEALALHRLARDRAARARSPVRHVADGPPRPRSRPRRPGSNRSAGRDRHPIGGIEVRQRRPSHPRRSEEHREVTGDARAMLSSSGATQRFELVAATRLGADLHHELPAGRRTRERRPDRP